MSVIIPVHNGAPNIGDQLEALVGQTYRGDWEVIVSDNASTDRTREIVLSFADRLNVKLVDAFDSRGASYAHNVGRRAARGEFLACCDADDIVDSNWLDGLVAAAADHHMVGGRLDEDSLNAGVAWRPKVDEAQLHRTDWLPYAIGANLGIWASTLESVGGWGEEFLTSNDSELSYRVQVKGWTLGFAPDAVVKYRHRSSSKALFRQFSSYGRSDPLIHLEFRQYGHPRSSLWGAAKRWGWIVLFMPYSVINERTRSRWIYTAAYSVGRLRGSIKARTIFL